MKDLICITCPRGCHLHVDDDLNVTGNTCPRGAIYAKNELTHPVRTLTSTVAVKSESFNVVPVKSNEPLPKELIKKAIEVINKIEVNAPVHIGDIVVKNLFDTGIDIVVTRNIEK